MSKDGNAPATAQKTVEAAKQEAIESVRGNVKGMPVFNLLRNLRNIILYAPDSVNEATRQLTIPEKIHKSKLLPFRFLSAHREISGMHYDLKEGESSKIVFEDEMESRVSTREEFKELRVRVVAALETEVELACHNIPDLEGRAVILIDHSGSMKG